MLFMNEYDIAFAGQVAEREEWKVMADAVAILRRLADWANENSDGWSSWPLPSRAARQLQERIQEQETKARSSYPDQYDMTHNHRDAALRPIKAFLTRQNVSYEDRLWILEGVR